MCGRYYDELIRKSNQNMSDEEIKIVCVLLWLGYCMILVIASLVTLIRAMRRIVVLQK